MHAMAVMPLVLQLFIGHADYLIAHLVQGWFILFTVFKTGGSLNPKLLVSKGSALSNYYQQSTLYVSLVNLFKSHLR